MADAAGDPCLLADDGSDGARTIRIVGVFVILVASAAGIWLPWLTIARGLRTPMFFGTAFAAGIVLATAFVHILPEGDEAFKNPCLGFSGTFPWASTIAGGSVIIVFIIELLLRRCLASKLGLARPSTGPAERAAADPKTQSILASGSGHEADLEAAAAAPASPAAAAAEEPAPPKALEAENALKRSLVKAENGMAAAMLEAGIVFHSVFVGIDLGVNTDVSSARALVIALVFHQAFEGMALGSALVRAECSARRFAMLAAVFCLITPMGVAIGMGMGHAYNDNSRVSLGVTGAFNSVSAGILIFNGLVDLVVPVFMGPDPEAMPPRVRRSMPLLLAALLSVITGYCLMALIGNWA